MLDPKKLCKTNFPAKIWEILLIDSRDSGSFTGNRNFCQLSKINNLFRYYSTPAKSSWRFVIDERN